MLPPGRRLRRRSRSRRRRRRGCLGGGGGFSGLSGLVLHSVENVVGGDQHKVGELGRLRTVAQPRHLPCQPPEARAGKHCSRA